MSNTFNVLENTFLFFFKRIQIKKSTRYKSNIYVLIIIMFEVIVFQNENRILYE